MFLTWIIAYHLPFHVVLHITGLNELSVLEPFLEYGDPTKWTAPQGERT